MMWKKYIVRAGQALMIMRNACWITKATDTHSEYVIVIVFPEQKWLRERASMLHLYTASVARKRTELPFFFNFYFLHLASSK